MVKGAKGIREEDGAVLTYATQARLTTHLTGAELTRQDLSACSVVRSTVNSGVMRLLMSDYLMIKVRQ